jgi:hypothetical protein
MAILRCRNDSGVFIGAVLEYASYTMDSSIVQEDAEFGDEESSYYTRLSLPLL